MNQNYSLYFVLAIFLTVASFSFIQFVDAADDRTRLEAELVSPSTGKDDGKAKFEQRDDRTTFTVEIEDQDSNSIYEIRVDDIILATFTTDDSGFADFNLDSRDGDSIPTMTSGSWIQVIDSNGKVALSGKMIGTETTQDPNTPTPQPEGDPVATTNVIIPFGAKDKDVSEFYSPSSISVNLGDTVTWTNQDDADHTVTSRSSVFNSGVFGTNQSFSHKFPVDGTYEYFCQLHPWMVGTVVAGKGGDVSAPPSEPSPQPPIDPTPNPTPSSTSPQGPSQYTVTIPSGAAEQTITEFYSPKSISVNVSDSILWQNSDIGFHTVTSGKGSPDGVFDSGLFGPGETFSRQFSSVDTIDYFCVVHPWMTGNVIVGEGDFSIPPNQTVPPPTVPTTPKDSAPEILPTPESVPESRVLDVEIPQGAALQTVDEYYLPSTISINTSDSILWTNNDEGFHTVTSVEGGILDSGLFGPAETFSFQFNKAGNFDYFCVIHPWMTGSVAVTGPEKTNQNDGSETSLSPLKQMKKGVMAKDVQCQKGYDLILKITKEVGACVKPSSFPVLVQRGWGQ